MTLTALPQWVKPEQPNTLALYEAAALLNVENQWIRMSAADQRALIGHAVFGKQAFMVRADGVVVVMRKTCFGADYEACEYSTARIDKAARHGLKLVPGAFGPGILQ